MPKLLALCLTGLTLPLSAQSKPTSRDWQLVFMRQGHTHARLNPDEIKAATAGHQAYVRKLRAAGTLRLSGEVTRKPGEKWPQVLSVFLLAAKDKAAAAAICAKDPLVVAQYYQPEIHPWRGPLQVFQTVSLFNGKDLTGWHADIPAADTKKDLPPAFVVKDGLLISQGRPTGHLISNQSYANYRLLVEWRWPSKPGNCGILVHASKPRMLYKMFPQSIECQLHRGNAGDFWCIGEDIKVPNMVQRRGPKKNWGATEGKARRIRNLTDGSEKPAGQWNQMIIECRGSRIDVWVNGQRVNDGYGCTAQSGRIAIQAEGAACEFRRLELTQMPPLPE